ncbi:fibrobacter succinogenes major paralogous domain-containing protein [Butyricimonas paravirosa]|uniref:fibrobacter succinogenes major paralogous domain-containing protein n=1 Tax=Butyricimonas paravirosa TaxID=1472417 RepID=UPI002108DA58|nr:fibrobacter succinogenes major paralogous domain-containing protein [Butyricimonas paravirosa]MCQ4874662.1 fibrobacter succinogenes major paralogous domain-containing protein [Butyricimonas paravirosa]
MKQYMLLLLVMLFGSVACDDQDKISIQPEATGSYTDVRDGNEYHWVRYAGLEWMTENLKFVPEKGVFAPDLTPVPEGYYDDGKNAEYYKDFGGLYDYEAAKAAIPEGWRLPTDADWQKLERVLGMSSGDLEQLGRRGSVQGELLQQGTDGTGIDLQLSGYLIPDDRTMDIYSFVKVYGFYWTATVDETKPESNSVYYRQIIYNSSEVVRNSMTKNNLLSIRCVRDATSIE